MSRRKRFSRIDSANKARMSFNPENLYNFIKNPVFGMPTYDLDESQSKKIASTLPTLAPEQQIGKLLDGVSRAVGLYHYMFQNKELLQWTKARAKPLQEAEKAAVQLLQSLNQIDSRIRTWHVDGKPITVLLQECREVCDKIIKLGQRLPAYTPPHPTNYPFHVFIEKLLISWEEATGVAANRSQKHGSFLQFAAAVSDSTQLKMSKEQLVTTFRSVQRRRVIAGAEE